MQTAFHASTEHVLVQLLLQISVILIIARAVGMLFVRFGQSQSIGEIAAGVMMGPSLLGWIAPGLFSTLFVPHGPPILPFLSHIALILTLFLIGMEFDYGEIPKHGKQVAALALSTLISPLLAAACRMAWRSSSATTPRACAAPTTPRRAAPRWSARSA
ncbi:MAG TPA: cation:proton antiporter [Burkholderiaceae bacterium]|nr:cation:proton antiporter [Burkholderiaceae bacterium]